MTPLLKVLADFCAVYIDDIRLEEKAVQNPPLYFRQMYQYFRPAISLFTLPSEMQEYLLKGFVEPQFDDCVVTLEQDETYSFILDLEPQYKGYDLCSCFVKENNEDSHYSEDLAEHIDNCAHGDYGVTDESKFDGMKPQYEIDDSAPHMIRDNNKCILCRRCVAACEEQYVGVIGANNRGIDTNIGTPFEVGLSNVPCISCGQCTAVCPTGALVEYLPDDYVRFRHGSETYFRVDDTVYALTLIDGNPYFEVLGQL